MRLSPRIFSLALCLAASTLAPAQPPPAPPLAGFSAASAAWQRDYEARLKQILSPARAEAHLRWLTSRPHRTGTPEAKLTADYIRDRLVEYGFETEIVRYDAYLPAPVSVSLELMAPVQETVPLVEERIPGDPFTEQADAHPGWAGYSASGDVSGELVYARFGSDAEFRQLAALGVDVRGKIVLLRYFGTAGEGRKVANAQKYGAAGVIVYADPMEDGYVFGDVYPEGNWRPAGSIMRRSVEFLPYSGDPLTPGWAARPEAKRLDPEELPLPRIPVVPISYRSAERLLRLLGGPVAPADWRGALPVAYRLGPGPARLRLRAEMDNRVRPIWNVVGRLPGSADPDQWVILGNHHDAWIFGAGDPSSGTASLLELARALGQLGREGYRPRRTLLLAFWDAEEMMLGGSTEWVEDHAEELLEKAVACVNMDSSVFNPERPLRVAAHPVLHPLFRSVARELTAAAGSDQPLFDHWRDMQNRLFYLPSVDGFGEFLDPSRALTEPWIFEVPSDDAFPFYQFLALPASDMYYGGDYGMYHSLYENFHWMKTVVDPTFEYHILMAQLQGLVGLRLANADLIPFDFAGEARFWRLAYADLERTAHARGQVVPEFKRATALVDQWEREAERLNREIAALVADAARFARAQGALREINRQLYRIPRDFHRPAGRPSATTERNLFAGSSYGLEGASGGTLPGIRFALDAGRLEEARAEARLYVRALERRLASLRAVREKLAATR
jgi:N-acetylated-alpha-linked acidic dipeptidase